jgi:anti-sigma regulatory factor (Ser/Thr protein kinase)
MRGLMQEVGHAELSETAELATSELVTNAVLHARTAISVVVEVNGPEVMVEIRDGSDVAPVQPAVLDAAADQATLSSVGNGLRILGSVTRSWGIRENPGVGKAVWFVPAPDPGAATAPDTEAARGQLATGADVVVVLLDAPVTLLWIEMSRCRDLARELSLVLMGDPGGPLVETAQTFMETYVTDEDDWKGLQDAYARGEDGMDLHVRVDRSRVAYAPEFARLLDFLDELSRVDALLTVPALPEAAAVRAWVLTEIEHQVSGVEARPWRG